MSTPTPPMRDPHAGRGGGGSPSADESTAEASNPGDSPPRESTPFDPFRFGRPEPGSAAAAAYPHLFPPQPPAGPGYPSPGGVPSYPPQPPAGPGYPSPGGVPGYPPPQAGTGLGYPPPQPGTYPPPGAGARLDYPPPQPGTAVGSPTAYPYVHAPAHPGSSGYGYPGGPEVNQPANGKAVAGFVLGIVGVVLFFLTLLDAIPIVLAFVFSIQGLRAAARGKGQRGLAIAGLVLASLATVIVVVTLVVVAVRSNQCRQHHDPGTKAYSQCLVNF